MTALLAGRNYVQAAAAAGVSVRQLGNWRNEPAFSAALRSARDLAFSETLEALRGAAHEAMKACQALLKPAIRSDVRIAAARTLLTLALKAHEDVNVDERLRALEARLK